MSEKIKKEDLYLYIKSFYSDVVPEFKFLEKRRFKFDFYIPSKKCGIEYEGLFSHKSRHTSVAGYNNDCVKYSLASLNGFRLIRITALTTYEELENYLKML